VNDRGPRWVWLDDVRTRVREETLSSRAGHVALVLAVHYANGRCEAWPSYAELAAVTGWSRRTVMRAIDELEQQQLLTIRRGRPARTSGNVYHLNLS
jgi:DNA-binding MarR family transcriptional regulator